MQLFQGISGDFLPSCLPNFVGARNVTKERLRAPINFGSYIPWYFDMDLIDSLASSPPILYSNHMTEAEKELREALFALNRAKTAEPNKDDAKFIDTASKIVWYTGVQVYGWRD